MTVNKQGKSRLFHWALGVFFLTVAAALIFGVTQYRDIPMEVSAETTIYTQPLRSDGKVDFLKAFEEVAYTEHIATEQNGFRLLFQNVDLLDELPEWLFPVVCKQLDLNPSTTKPAGKFNDPFTFAFEYVRSKELDVEFLQQLTKDQPESESLEKEEPWTDIEKSVAAEMIVARSINPWTDKDLPMFVDWIKQNSQVLDQVSAAVQMEKFEVPVSRSDDQQLMINTLCPYVQTFRSFARGYQSRANYYLGVGEIRKAIDDVIACKRLGRHTRNLNTTVERLVGVAIEGIADSIAITTANGKQATKADLEYLVSELNRLPKVIEPEENVLLFERLASVEILQLMATSDETPFKELDELSKIRSLGLDWNVVFKEFNQTFDANWKGQFRTHEEEEFLTAVEFFSRWARSKKFAKKFADFTFASREVLNEADHRLHCSHNLRMITIAMLLYEKDHGKLPPAFTTDNDGKPLHSWRVLLLPYLGEQELFDKFKLDEPWNSPHHSELMQSCPSVFVCPSCEECEKGQTSYTVILGDELPFEGKDGKPLSQFGVGSGKMILVAERSSPVDWLDPTKELKQSEAEIGINRPFQSGDKKTPIGSNHRGGSQFGFRDGAVEYLSENTEEDNFKAMLKGNSKRFVAR